MSDTNPYEIVNHDIDLTEFDDDFGSVEAPKYEEVPDGKYQVRINSARLANSQSGTPMIKWDLIVLSGPQAGRHIFKNSVISQASLPFVKGDLSTAGLNLAKFSDLADRLEDLLDVNLEITKRTKGDYTNVYFNRRIEIAAGNSVNGVPSDQIPF